MKRALLFLPLLLLPLAAQEHSSEKSAAHGGGGHGAPTAPSPGVRAMDAFADEASGALHLLITEMNFATGKPEARHLRSLDEGKTWSPPVSVGGSLPPPHAANRGMDPQIAASGAHVVAVWMTPGTDRFGGGPMATALSDDGGQTWKPGPNPADDGSTDGHGFIDITADEKGRFHLVWLDSRSEKRGLRYARSTDNGASWSPNATLDESTCECCWNTVQTHGETVAVLYRDTAPRDMAAVFSRDGGSTWERPVSVGAFDWQVEACPHVGGGLTWTGAGWRAVVWTGGGKKPGVYSLQSDAEGKTWSELEFLSSTAIHPAVVMAEKGPVSAFTVRDPADPAPGTRVALRNGEDSEASVISAPDASASHPILLTLKGKVHAFWTETPIHQPTIWRTRVISP